MELLKPTEDLEVNGDERLALEYRSSDDYGIQQVTLVAAVGDREETHPGVARRPCSKPPGNVHLGPGPPSASRKATWWSIILEVLDNDTISGPKLVKSRPLSLRLKNLKAEHRQVAEMIRDISDKMVDLLGDHLEAPPDEQTPGDPGQQVAEGLDRMMQRVDDAMQRTRVDRISDFATWSDLETLKRNLEHARNDLVERMRQGDLAGGTGTGP